MIYITRNEGYIYIYMIYIDAGEYIYMCVVRIRKIYISAGAYIYMKKERVGYAYDIYKRGAYIYCCLGPG